MFEPYVGEIVLFAGSRLPKQWALCDGSILPIRQYINLFGAIGYTYGGETGSTFALPNLPPQGGARYIIAWNGVYPSIPIDPSD